MGVRAAKEALSGPVVPRRHFLPVTHRASGRAGGRGEAEHEDRHGDARRRGVKLVVELPPSLPKVHADPVGLRQVLLNLVMNGMDEVGRPDVSEREFLTR